MHISQICVNVLYIDFFQLFVFRCFQIQKGGILKDIRELREVVELIVQYCQHSYGHIIDMANYPEDLARFFHLCSWLESQLLDKKNDTAPFVWEIRRMLYEK